ncbi:MAG TPA: DUF4870 domain-containing protein [Thermoanaerobaculia bacterium]|nr:DUF4870 domain-containing protein [Thermoanaerobaculia bacterium]
MSDPTVPPGPPGPPPPSSPPPPPPGPIGAGAPPPPGGSGTPPYVPPGAPPPGGTESPNRGVMIVLSYLGLLALIPLLVEKDDREVQWHAKHGLVLTVFWFVVWLAVTLLSTLVSFVDLGCTGCVLYWVLIIAMLVVHVMAIVKGLNGQRLILPGISQFADRF